MAASLKNYAHTRGLFVDQSVAQGCNTATLCHYDTSREPRRRRRLLTNRQRIERVKKLRDGDQNRTLMRHACLGLSLSIRSLTTTMRLLPCLCCLVPAACCQQLLLVHSLRAGGPAIPLTGTKMPRERAKGCCTEGCDTFAREGLVRAARLFTLQTLPTTIRDDKMIGRMMDLPR
jgi:hypothetical protein